MHGSLFVAWNGDSPAQPTYSWRAVRAHSEQVHDGTQRVHPRTSPRNHWRVLLAEFRALRASVLRLYERRGDVPDLAGIRRFNESIDEALMESMTRYGIMTDLYRDHSSGSSAMTFGTRSTPLPPALRY